LAGNSNSLRKYFPRHDLKNIKDDYSEYFAVISEKNAKWIFLFWPSIGPYFSSSLHNFA
jgi:hypothetical protein